MRYRVGKLAAIVATAASLVVAQGAHAATYSVTATIYAIVSADSSWGTEADYLALDGVTSLGNCPKQGNGLVLFILKDDAKASRQFAMLLAAKTAGTPITIDAEDTYRSSQGYCYIRHVTY
ncbi:MAG: hypothetical protein ACJ8R9_25200 [Steroidobacteraceae bacterium]